MSHFRSIFFQLTALWALIVPVAVAQNTPVVIRASHNDAKFWVDGKPSPVCSAVTFVYLQKGGEKD